MSLSRAAYLFLQHLTMAAGLSFALLATGEYLIPGFASPFIDVVHFGLVVLALVVATVFCRPRDMEPTGVAGRVFQGFALLAAAMAGGILLWAKLDISNANDLGLLAVYGILCVIGIIATVRKL